MNKPPDLQVIQNRYFSTRDIREVLRSLSLGVENSEFKRLWKEGVVTSPQVAEPEYTAWDYRHAKQLIIDFYNLKGDPQDYDTRKVDALLIEKKELKRYRHELVTQYHNRGKFIPY